MRAVVLHAALLRNNTHAIGIRSELFTTIHLTRENELERTLSSLKNALYSCVFPVSLCGVRTLHQILFIKQENSTFIFDPNCGLGRDVDGRTMRRLLQVYHVNEAHDHPFLMIQSLSAEPEIC